MTTAATMPTTMPAICLIVADGGALHFSGPVVKFDFVDCSVGCTDFDVGSGGKLVVTTERSTVVGNLVVVSGFSVTVTVFGSTM